MLLPDGTQFPGLSCLTPCRSPGPRFRFLSYWPIAVLIGPDSPLAPCRPACSRTGFADPADVGKSKGVALGDVDADRRLDVVLSPASARAPLSGVACLPHEESVFDPVWRPTEISGPVGSKYNRFALQDLDRDGDLDALTTEQNHREGSASLGVIWHQNPGQD